MAYQPENYGDSDEKKLAYDLRQIYANVIVGSVIVDIKIARENKNYPSWFDALKNLYDNIEMHFKEPEDDNKEHDELTKNVNRLANTYQSAYLGTSTDSLEISQIEDSLRSLQRFLYKKMKEGGMFGERYEDDDGL